MLYNLFKNGTQIKPRNRLIKGDLHDRAGIMHRFERARVQALTQGHDISGFKDTGMQVTLQLSNGDIWTAQRVNEYANENRKYHQ